MGEAGRGRWVLVVDDEETIRLLVGRVLSHAGYEVDYASDGAAAIRKIDAKRPDLVVLDLMMPGIDGWGVVEHLRRGPAPPPVVIISAHGDDGTFARAVREGVAAYLPKPFSLRELVATCERSVLAAGGDGPS